MSAEAPIARADVVVVGAGVMGASIAFQLSRKSDKRVVVVDARPPVGGMSGRTFGQIRQHYSNALMVDMSIRGFDTLENWSERVGYGDPGYVRMGYMLLVSENQLEPLKRNIALGQSRGVDTRFIEPDEIQAIEPAVDVSTLCGGAYEPNGGYIDVTRMVLSWLGAAQGAGVRLMTPLKVDSIVTASGRVLGVATEQGLIETPCVVMATGAWARDLFVDLGIDIPIERQRLDMMYVEPGSAGHGIRSCVTDGVSNVVMRPDMGASMLVAAYPPRPIVVDDPTLLASPKDREEHRHRIERAFAGRLPQLLDFKELRSISGAYDVTPDFHPIVGWAPGIEGLYLAMGFSGHGLKLSPAIGEVTAAMVLGDEPPLDVSPLRYERFSENDLMFLAYGPSARA